MSWYIDLPENIEKRSNSLINVHPYGEKQKLEVCILYHTTNEEEKHVN